MVFQTKQMHSLFYVLTTKQLFITWTVAHNILDTIVLRQILSTCWRHPTEMWFWNLAFTFLLHLKFHCLHVFKGSEHYLRRFQFLPKAQFLRLYDILSYQKERARKSTSKPHNLHFCSISPTSFRARRAKSNKKLTSFSFPLTIPLFQQCKPRTAFTFLYILHLPYTTKWFFQVLPPFSDRKRIK